MIHFRKATVQDLPAIKLLADEMLRDTPLSEASSVKILRLIESSSVLFNLAYSDDELIGFMCGAVYENIYNDDIKAADIGLYVKPEFRGTEAAPKLVQHFETWAKDRNAKVVTLGQSTGQNIEAVKRFYENLGYKVVGYNTIKELQ